MGDLGRSFDGNAQELKREHDDIVKDALHNWRVAAGVFWWEFENLWDERLVRHEFEEYFEDDEDQPIFPDGTDFIRFADLDLYEIRRELNIKKSTAKSVKQLSRLLRQHREFDKMSNDELLDLLQTEHHSAAWKAFLPFFSSIDESQDEGVLNQEDQTHFLVELTVVCQSISPENQDLARRIVNAKVANSWKEMAHCSRWQLMEAVRTPHFNLGREVTDKLLCISMMMAHESLRQTLESIFKNL